MERSTPCLYEVGRSYSNLDCLGHNDVLNNTLQ